MYCVIHINRFFNMDHFTLSIISVSLNLKRIMYHDS